MLNFFKKLFALFSQRDDFPVVPVVVPLPVDVTKYPLGAQDNEPDVRTIDFAQLSAPLKLPVEYRSDLSPFPVFSQTLGTCVAESFALAKMVLDYIETTNVTVYSRRFLYSLAKRFLGDKITDDVSTQGLPPIAAAKIITAVGAFPEPPADDLTLQHTKYVNDYVVTSEMRAKANITRAKGFAQVQVNPVALKQAIFQAKTVSITLLIDWLTYTPDGTFHTPKRIDGKHEVTLYGWEQHNGRERFIFRNSWGKDFGDNGDGYIYTDEIESVVGDAIVLTDIPNDLLQRAKQYQYLFLTTLKFGSRGEAVYQLQKRLVEYGVLKLDSFTTTFGFKTYTALMQWQKLKGLSDDGILGPAGREALNNDVGLKKSKIDLWAGAIVRMEGADPSLNNPGNIKYVGQSKAIGKSSKGFCIFPDYATGYMELRNLLVRAATGQGNNYEADETLNEFYAGIPMPNRYGREIYGYAPESDNNKPNHYAKFVADVIGVPVTTLLRDLL